jgi:hypothetical protein
VEYRANEQELQRMKQEQQVDNELQQVCSFLLVQILVFSKMCYRMKNTCSETSIHRFRRGSEKETMDLGKQ